MNSSQIHQTCSRAVDDILDRLHLLCSEGRAKDAQALYDEIRDWIVNKDGTDVLSLEYLDEY